MCNAQAYVHERACVPVCVRVRVRLCEYVHMCTVGFAHLGVQPAK